MKATPKTDEVISVLKQAVTVINLIEYSLKGIEKADDKSRKADSVITAYQSNVDDFNNCKVTAKDVYNEYWEICPSVESLPKCAKALATRFENVGIPVWVCDPYSDYQERVNNKIWSMNQQGIVTKSQASDLMCLFDLLANWLMVWVFRVRAILKEMGVEPLPILTDKSEGTGDEESDKPTVVPKQDIAKPQQKSQPVRGKGRPKETLKDKMINDADGSKLQKVHTVMDGKKGKDAALIVLACIKKGWMSKPTFIQVTEEFGDIGTQQNFTKYLNENRFTIDEIEGAKNSLD